MYIQGEWVLVTRGQYSDHIGRVLDSSPYDSLVTFNYKCSQEHSETILNKHLVYQDKPPIICGDRCYVKGDPDKVFKAQSTPVTPHDDEVKLRGLTAGGKPINKFEVMHQLVRLNYDVGDTVYYGEMPVEVVKFASSSGVQIVNKEGSTKVVLPSELERRFDKKVNKSKPTNPTKESKMKQVLSQQLEANKDSATLAARITAGKAINKRVMKLVKPKLPMMVRGYADSPIASVVLANIVGLAMKQYMPQSSKAQLVASMMLDASALQAIESFDLESILESVLEGVKLPEEVEKSDEDN